MLREFDTGNGKLTVNIIGHASYIFEWGGTRIYCDPYSEVADFSLYPLADLLLITHNHYDHLDHSAFRHVVSDKTTIVCNPSSAKLLPNPEVLKNGESFLYKNFTIDAVPAYNIINHKNDGSPFHPSGEGNGYIISAGGFRLYVAGDTELIPEMSLLRDIDLALLPKNLPYTMSDAQFVEAVAVIRPKYVIATHFFDMDSNSLRALMPDGVVLLND